MRSKPEMLIALWDTQSGTCVASFPQASSCVILIGRDDANDISLQAKGVSKKHCRILLDRENLVIEDLGSTNGVLVVSDSKSSLLRSQKAELRHGDTIKLGEASLRLELSRPPDDRTEIVHSPIIDATELVVRNPDCDKAQSAVDNPMRVFQTFQPKPFLKGSASSAGNSHAKDESLQTRLVSEGPFSFSRYQVIKKIGEGGMGTVYSAIDENQTVFAIKFLKSKHQSPQDLARFSREIEIAQQLKHSAIVECIDCGQEDGVPYIVMPFCSGGNLAELLSRTGTIQLRRAFKLLDRLLAGLEYAHQLGIVHRDLKPCNILLGKDSKGKYRPMISDFGLAKFYQMAGDSGMTTNGTVGGSWPYMPREQLTNFRFVTPQSDVWSMGAILYECLTGQLPRGPSPKKDPFLAVLNADVIPITTLLGQHISSRVSRFVMKCLAIDLDERYSDATQMRVALQIVAKAEGIEL